MPFSADYTRQFGDMFGGSHRSEIGASMSSFLRNILRSNYGPSSELWYKKENKNIVDDYIDINPGKWSKFNRGSGRDKKFIISAPTPNEFSFFHIDKNKDPDYVASLEFANKRIVIAQSNVNSRIESKEKIFTGINMESNMIKNHFISFSIDEIFLFHFQEAYGDYPNHIKTYSPGIGIKNTIEFNAYKLNRLIKKILLDNNGFIFSTHGIGSKYNDYKFTFAHLPNYEATLVYAIARGYEGNHRLWYQIAYNGNEKEIADRILRPVHKFLEKKKIEKKNGVFYTIEPGEFDNKLTLHSNNIKNKTIINDLDLHYGDGFKKKYDGLKTLLEDKKKNGVILLHGVPGSGKSNFLKHMISTVNAEFVYADISIIENIDNAGLSKLIKKMDGKIFIIEDAERLIIKRDEYARSGISGLLNYADGIIGSAIRIKFIITFNTQVTNIDPALKRAGRMLFEHKFGTLDEDRAQKLMDIVRPGYKAKPNMTLSDIYNINFDNHSEEKDPASGIL